MCVLEQPTTNVAPENIQVRVFGESGLPTLVYLPGLHGDWTLITEFRAALAGRLRIVEVTYPRTLNWSLADYTDAIESALGERGIDHGWLLGESFGSQLAWPLVEKDMDSSIPKSAAPFTNPFKVDGLILANGFVKHPWKRGPKLMRWIGGITPAKLYRFGLGLHACRSRFHHPHSAESLAASREFVARRTEIDRMAMRHRLTLMDSYDASPVARRTHVPVYYLAGLVDPLVPWMTVRRWLRRNCPGYRGGKTLWLANHNVLNTSPVPSAHVVFEWIGEHRRTLLQTRR